MNRRKAIAKMFGLGAATGVCLLASAEGKGNKHGVKVSKDEKGRIHVDGKGCGTIKSQDGYGLSIENFTVIN